MNFFAPCPRGLEPLLADELVALGATDPKAVPGGVQFADSMMGYGGSTIGYATSVWSDPTTGVTVAVMLNNSTNDAGIVRSLAFQLAALAATAPAAGGQTVPEFGLPWTFEDEGNSVRAQAICPVP